MDHDNGVERAIGRLEGKVDAIGKEVSGVRQKLENHISDEATDTASIRNDIRQIREDVLVSKTQRRMAMIFVGATSGVVSSLATLKTTLGKFWPS